MAHRTHLDKLALACCLLLAACSDDAETTGPGSGGGGSTSTGGQGPGGGAGGPSYEDAIKAASWAELANAPTVTGGAKQDDIFFLDPERGFLASGPGQTIYATTDGGASWSSVFQSNGTFFRAVLFTDDQHGFAGNIGAGLTPAISDPNVIYATTDGGDNWEPVTAITGSTPEGICNFTAIDATHLVGVGRANGPAHLMQSSDGGASWTATDLGAWLTMAIDAHFTSPTEGLVAGMGMTSRCTIIRTTDGGTSFEPVFESATPASLCWKLQFPTSDIGYAAVQDSGGGPGSFGKTTDGGATWEELPLPTTAGYAALAVGFITENIGWMAADTASLPVYRTYDGGMTWEQEPVLVGPINRFRFVDQNTAYAVGATVWKLQITYP